MIFVNLLVLFVSSATPLFEINWAGHNIGLTNQNPLSILCARDLKKPAAKKQQQQKQQIKFYIYFANTVIHCLKRGATYCDNLTRRWSALFLAVFNISDILMTS